MNRILFMAMSTFPNEYKANTFRVEAQDFVISDCIGQMEPVAKYMMMKYPDDPIRIVVLCTPETQKKAEKGDFKGETPIGFFKNQLDEFRLELDLPNPDIYEVELSLDSPYAGITEAVEIIRELRCQEAERCFWIDPHGAFRDVALIIQAIISLLKVDGIVPDEIMGIRYRSGNDIGGENYKENQIIPQREAYDMFNFVTGMNDFINFGNADVLKMYFEEGKEGERAIVEAIDKIAQGTQLCYPVLYRQGLNELEAALQSASIKNHTILGLFKEYIEDSYGALLKSKTRTILGIVKHCYKKKLYQQALTFIESDMPEEIISKGILTFADENFHNELILKEAKKVNIRHFVFDTFITMGNLSYGEKKDQHKWAIKQFSENKRYYYEALKKGSYDQGPVFCNVNTAAGNEKLPFDVKPDKKEYEIVKIGTKLPREYYGTVGIFLRMHRALKGVRNLFNHADQSTRNIEAILDAMELYIAYAECLYAL